MNSHLITGCHTVYLHLAFSAGLRALVQVAQQWLSRDRKAKNQLVVQSTSLCSPSLRVGSRRTPGELLVFSLQWDPEEVGFNTSSHRIDELAR